MTVLNLKRGDTLELGVKLVDDNNQPIDLTGYTIKMDGKYLDNDLAFSLRTGNGITITNKEEGEYKIELNNTDFRIGKIKTDIQYNKNGNIKSTDTFYIDVIEDITA